MLTRELEVLFQDQDYVGINKPAGLAVIPGRGETTSALELIAQQLQLPWTGPADPRIRVVHRIDKETSGVVLFALNLPAQRLASIQFQEHRVEKEYLALVAGKLTADQGEVDAPLAPHPTSKLRMAVSKHGRAARTIWQVEERFKLFTLVRLFPKTGKTHQIRVHMQSIGHSLAIDPLYNPKAPPAIFLSSFKRAYYPGEGDERPLIARLTLHAEKLRLDGASGAKMEIVAPVPKDFRAAIQQLRKYAS